jgi:Fe-S-cluster containining protein
MTDRTNGKGDRAHDLLTGESPFQFRCHPGLGCFTACCRDVNIFLMPYDVIRIKQRLGISSEEFLRQYTITLLPRTAGFPLLVLKMGEDQEKRCPFVKLDGCSIYEDRPWSCRMYPLDREDPDGRFRCIADPSFCLGLGEEKKRSVGEYFREQGLGPYEEKEAALRRLVSDPRLSKERVENPKVQEMCRMALYDLDRFRRFVLESRFLQIFYVDKKTIRRIKTDDVALMKLAHRWLEFGLISGATLRIREDILKQEEAESTH